jgi:hypothetical protein
MATLVNGVTMHSSDALTGLLHTVRNRIWMQALVDSGSMGAAAGACLLLAGGLLHSFSDALPARFWLLFALLATVPFLIFALLYQRPSLPSAARAADHWFHGHELLTSALPLTSPGHPVRFATEELVITRANELAAQWQTELPLRRPYNIPAYNLASVMLVGASLFLLSLPVTRAPAQDTQTHETPRLSGNRETPDMTASGPSLQQQLQDALHTPAAIAPATTATNRETAPAAAGSNQSGQQEIPVADGNGLPDQTGPAASGQSTVADTSHPDGTPNAPPDSHAIAASGTSDSSGADTAAWTGSSGDAPADTRTADIQPIPGTATRFMEFARRPASHPGAAQDNTSGSELDKFTGITINAGQTGMTLPAAVHSILPQHSDLGPADRDLAANYFKRMNTR